MLNDELTCFFSSVFPSSKLVRGFGRVQMLSTVARFYSATSRTGSTGPSGRKLINQNVNLEQRIGSFLVLASNRGLFDTKT